MPNSTINATVNGLNSTAGNVATLDLQVAGSTVASATASGVSVTGTLSASGATTLSGAVSASSLSVNSNNISADNSLGFRNRIINGDMRIDQRNAGAAVSANNAFLFTVDRWIGDARGASGNGVISFQQNSIAPVGFVNSLAATLTTQRTSPASGDVFAIYQKIEGTNLSDIAWGTANAKTITVSFWVRSSVTGTYSGAVSNSAQNRSYPFTFTINSANTFEYKTVTITGDTSGTWLTTTGIGMWLYINLGCGSTYLGTAGAWASAALLGATGSTNWATQANNSTFYITGVQLEVGSVATPFERRPYGTELALCQRYLTVIPATSYIPAYATTSTTGYCIYNPPVVLRVAPTGISTTVSGNLYSGTTARALTNLTFTGASTASVLMTGTVASGLTSEAGTMLYTANAIQLTGCEL